MEPLVGDDDGEAESIPLYTPRTTTTEAPQPLEEKEEMATLPIVEVLKEASTRVTCFCRAGPDWELMENEEESLSGSLLCFRYQNRSGLYRVAGHLAATANTIVANLNQIPCGSVLLSTQHVKTFGENIAIVQHTVRLPPSSSRSQPLVLKGVKQCVFMEDSNSYLYVFATMPTEGVSVLFGVRVCELDHDQGSEVEAILEWKHAKPGLSTWLSDRWLETFWMTAENLVEWAQFFATTQ
jgi:hypothetical protein